MQFLQTLCVVIYNESKFAQYVHANLKKKLWCAIAVFIFGFWLSKQIKTYNLVKVKQTEKIKKGILKVKQDAMCELKDHHASLCLLLGAHLIADDDT